MGAAIAKSVGFDRSSKTYASDTFAALTRERWADYVKTFVPIENQLIDYATNPNTVSNAMAGASANVNAAYDAREGMLGRRLQGLGLTLSGDESAASGRATSLSRSVADVQGQNLARDATISRQQQILGNPAPDVVRAGQAMVGG
jgi:hypothetical protein